MSTGDRDQRRDGATFEQAPMDASSTQSRPAPGKVTRTMPPSMAEPSAGSPMPTSRAPTAQPGPGRDPWVMDEGSMAAMGLALEPDDQKSHVREPATNEACRLPGAAPATRATPAPSATAEPAGRSVGGAASDAGPDSMWRHVIGERSTAVGKLARVRAPKGVQLRTRAAADQPSLGILPFDELVTVERRTEHGWCWVIPSGALSGAPGFCEEHFLALDPPEPTAHLHRVVPGDELRVIAERYYGKQLRAGRDARLYVQALYEANKHHKGVYLTEVQLGAMETANRWEDDEKTLEIYKGAKVREGHALWLPSEAFIERLRASGAISGGTTISSQAWRGAKEAAGEAVDAVTYGAAFTVGILEGAWGSIVDLFQGAADLLELVAKTAYQLLTGNPGAVKAMLMGWIAKLKAAWKSRDKLADDFMQKWESDDAWTRGNFQGEVLGWVMMTALLILATSGAASIASAAAAGGRWARVLRLLATVDALGDVTTYLAKLGRLPAKVLTHLRSRFGKKAADATSEATQDAAKATEKSTEEATVKSTDATRDLADTPPSSPTKSLPADEWVEQLKAKLTPDELAQYEKMKGKWKSPEDMQRTFDGDFDAARADLARELGKKAEAAALKARSSKRADEIHVLVEEQGLMKHPEVRRALDGLPDAPSSQDIDNAVFHIRSVIVSEIRAEEISLRFPKAKIVREVKVWQELPGVSATDRLNMSTNEKRASFTRIDNDGEERVYRLLTDIDLLVHQPPGSGKSIFVRLEQQKTGATDTHTSARAQNDVALEAINASEAGGPRIRMEVEDKVDISDQFDLSSAARAEQVTVGPAGKGFDESLGINAHDLNSLIKKLVKDLMKESSQ